MVGVVVTVGVEVTVDVDVCVVVGAVTRVGVAAMSVNVGPGSVGLGFRVEV
jgi:hypothetical protein